MKAIRKVFLKLLYSAIITILLFSLSPFPALAIELPTETFQLPLVSPPEQPDEEPIVPPRPSRGKPTDLQELEEFANSFFEKQLEEEKIAGVAVAIVQNDEILIRKGYGYANVEEEIPVDPDKTVFRVASISKLFTDTAIMQLYEAGKLDLHGDINDYLKAFKIDNGYPEPITPANLLTQTEGTSQRLIDIGARSPEGLIPLEEFIPESMPPFSWRPGEVYTYSNMGVTLAGYVVQEVSETPFIEYIEENLLKPLEMNRSTFQQPLPDELAKDLAVGYQYNKGKNEFESVPFLYLNIIPAATLSTTVTDMAHFMIAHLQGGSYKDGRILEPDTTRLMHDQHFVHFPGLPGSAYGFHERYENDIRALGHAGSLRGYSSAMSLIPEEGIGIFIATNSYNNIHESFIKQFLDHYYPVESESISPTIPADFQPERFTGTYRDIEYPRGSFAKLSATMGHLNVKANEEGTLAVQTPDLFFPGKVPNRTLIPVPDTPLLFQWESEENLAAFGEDENGNIQYLFNPIRTTLGAYTRIAWWESVYFQLGLALVCNLVFLSAAIIWLGGFIKHLFYKGSSERKLARVASLLASVVSLLYLVFTIGLPLYLWLFGIWKLVYGVPLLAQILLYFPPIAVVLTVPLVIFAILAWTNNYWSMKARSYYSLITLAAVAFVPFLWYWNLIQ